MNTTSNTREIIEKTMKKSEQKSSKRLVARIAGHVHAARNTPTSPLMYIGKILSYILMGLMCVFTLVVLIKPDILTSILTRILYHTASLGSWNYLLASAITFVESIPFLNIAVPGQTIAIVIAGYVAQFNFLGILCVVVLSSTLGDAVAYRLGRKKGSYMLAHFGPIFGLNDVVVDKIENFLERMGNRAVFVSKRNPYARGFLPFIAGTLRMNFREFMIWNIIGSAVYGTVVVFLAKLFVGHYRDVVPYVRWIGLGLVVVLAVRYWWKYEKQK